MADNSVLIVNSAAFLTALLVTVAATPVVRKIALRWKLGDKPNGRKIHTHLIPHLIIVSTIRSDTVAISSGIVSVGLT